MEGIELLPRTVTKPDAVSSLVRKIEQDRSSPGPTEDEVLHDLELEALEGGMAGVPESQVQQYFQQKIFLPRNTGGPPNHSVQLPILSHAIPRNPETVGASGPKSIVGPVPDLMYGYNLVTFTRQQQNYLAQQGYGLQATTYQLYMPFLIVEFKSEGGKLRAATNQCLGGSACCANITERINRLVQAASPSSPSTGPPKVDSPVFSIAMDNNIARLFVSWQTEDGFGYNTVRVKDFSVQRPEIYILFRRYVHNILDWGYGERFDQVRAALDFLIADSRREAAAPSKVRGPPTPPARPESMASGSPSGSKRQRR